MKHNALVAAGAVGFAVVGAALEAQAAGLGIPLDGFLGNAQNWVIGLGFIVGLVGLLGYVGSLMDNPFSHILAGSIGFFTKAGLLGGGTIILGALGLVAGGTL